MSDFQISRLKRPSILVLTLHPRGDFKMGLSALQQLRAAFRQSHVTLVCRSWDVPPAQELALADEIRAYDDYPDDKGRNGGSDRFRAVCRGHFDIAIDLRVDQDTRPLLREVHASLRCG